MSGYNFSTKNHKNSTGPAIMESLDSLLLSRDGNPSLNNASIQDLLSLHGVSLQDNNDSKSLSVQSEFESFLLIDGNEFLKVYIFFFFVIYYY